MEPLTELIRDRSAHFSKGQKRIAEYITSNPEEAAFLTAAKLGEKAEVSESTVVRFAFALGFDGYPSMQDALRDLIRNRLTSVQRIRMAGELTRDDIVRHVLTEDIANIRTTLESIDMRSFEQAISMLLAARRIYVIGVRSSAPLALFLSYYLDYVCEDVTYLNGGIQDFYQRMSRLGEDDLCIGISFPRYSSRTLDAMRFAQKNGAKTIVITDTADSPFRDYADCTVCAHSSMAGYADSLVAPLSVLNAIIMAVGQARKDEAYGHLNRLEEIWREEGIYMMDDHNAKERER